ncbi:hypothetical protein M5689_017985 [Euphorbia peplus]|nr:hypothetical protein M5689_017985 [Euphorbia peplus]
MTGDSFRAFAVTCWFLWHHGNKVVHGGVFQVAGLVVSQVADWFSNCCTVTAVPVRSPTVVPSRGSPPNPMWFKINSDTTWKKDLACGIGAVIRDDVGDVAHEVAASSDGLG